jgi:hypothetical protein
VTDAGDWEVVLRGNDRDGHHTIPAAGLYPHQWNWDSAFIALGWAALGEEDRAWRELESLLAGQDPTDGLVAHIAFDPAATSYEPGPRWWSGRVGGDGRRISDISQPPVAATIIRVLSDSGADLERARPLLPLLRRWLGCLIEDRSHGDEPVVGHPWETGRDNSIDWDLPVSAVTPSTRVPGRRDLAVIADDERPPDRDYARYYGILESSDSFRILDPAFSAMTAAAAADLSIIASDLDDVETAGWAFWAAGAAREALRSRAGDDGVAPVRDLLSGADIALPTASRALQLLRGDLDPATVELLAREVLNGALASPFGVRSAAASTPGFEPRNYWRGPVWANVTWLCALGLERHGRTKAAAELRSRLLRHAAVEGCREYVEPDTGEGLGAAGFSWTAALALWTTS